MHAFVDSRIATRVSHRSLVDAVPLASPSQSHTPHTTHRDCVSIPPPHTRRRDCVSIPPPPLPPPHTTHRDCVYDDEVYDDVEERACNQVCKMIDVSVSSSSDEAVSYGLCPACNSVPDLMIDYEDNNGVLPARYLAKVRLSGAHRTCHVVHRVCRPSLTVARSTLRHYTHVRPPHHTASGS